MEWKHKELTRTGRLHGHGFCSTKKRICLRPNRRILGFGQRKTKKLAHCWVVIFVFGRKKNDFSIPTKKATRASS